MNQLDQWSLTIIRAHGLNFLRPERSWRPIVTIAVEEDSSHEVLLGIDGQNPNLKAPFYLRDVHAGSKVDIKIWHRSQSKKKAKRRTLVATACHPLGYLMKSHESAPKVEIRLNCQLPHRKGSASKGKPQNGALLVVKIRPPESFKSSLDDEGSESSLETGFLTPPSPTSDRTVSDWQSEDGMPFEDSPQIRGYLSGSDNDTLNNDHLDQRPISESPKLGGDDEDGYGDAECVAAEPPYWLFPSLLPSYTEKIQVDSPPSFVKRLLSYFTMYTELREATLDSHFEAVFTRLQQEWTYVGGLLVALAAVDTAVFSMSSGPGSLFNVDKFAQGAVAASSVASGVGISCDAWFLLRYNWADVHTFRIRAKDLYDSYFFFSLSARLPSLSMLLSALSLMVFLARVAFNAWPEAVIVISALFGVVMSLQFLVFGAHWCGRRMLDGSRLIYKKLFQPGPPPYES